MTKRDELKSLKPFMAYAEYLKAEQMIDFIDKLDSPSAVSTFEAVLDRTYLAPARAKKAAKEAACFVASTVQLDTQLLRTATELETEVSAIEAEALAGPKESSFFSWIRSMLKALGF